MSKKRIIDQKIRASQNFASLSLRQRDLWHGLIVTVDDQGRMPGQPTFVRSKVWPYDSIEEEDVEKDLNRLAEDGFITLYSVDGAHYLQIINWWRYQSMQWAGPSDYPPPDGWIDRARYHGKAHKVETINWESDGGYTNKGSRLGSNKGRNKGKGLGSRDININVNDNDNDNDNDNEEISIISSLYESKIGPLDSMMGDQIDDWLMYFPLVWVEDAINIAGEQKPNKRNRGYINGILKNWESEGRGDNHKSEKKEPAGFPALRKYKEKMEAGGEDEE